MYISAKCRSFRQGVDGHSAQRSSQPFADRREQILLVRLHGESSLTIDPVFSERRHTAQPPIEATGSDENSVPKNGDTTRMRPPSYRSETVLRAA
jgi:hypothetical protein